MAHYKQNQLDIVFQSTTIPEGNASFDVILSSEIFEYLPLPLAAIKDFSHLCISGVRLIIAASFYRLTDFYPTTVIQASL